MSAQFMNDSSARARLRVGLLRETRQRVAAVTLESAIRAGLTDSGHDASVIRMPVGAVGRCARDLWRCDMAIVQHDQDLDRCRHGAARLEIVRGLPVPAIVVLHSIPSHPTRREAAILTELCELAALVLVLSEAAKTVLMRTYPVDADKVVVIPWGASNARVVRRDVADEDGVRDELLTWGSIAPGIGVEHVIDAVAILRAKGQSVSYTIVDDSRHGDRSFARSAYLAGLMQRAQDQGVGHLVRFDAVAGDTGDLTSWMSTASIVVLAYDDPSTQVSPELVESIAAGRPVIATVFPHALELLRDGAGIVVPHRSAVALAEAIRVATTDRCILDAMTRRAGLLAPSLDWKVFQRRFVQQCVQLAGGWERLAA